MSATRFSTLLIIVALIAVTALTFREVFATKAILPPEYRSVVHSMVIDRSYDSIENLRVVHSMVIDRSYDSIENLRVVHLMVIDRSYDSIENLRIDRSGKPAPKGNAACLSARDRLSLSSVYIQGAHAWFPRTAQGPTGVDGGLIELLAARNACQASIRSLA